MSAILSFFGSLKFFGGFSVGCCLVAQEFTFKINSLIILNILVAEVF